MCSSPVIASLCSSSNLLSGLRQNFNFKHRKSFVHRKSKKDRSSRLRLVYRYKASEQRTILWLVLFFFLFFVFQLLEILKNTYIFAPLSEHLASLPRENSIQALNDSEMGYLVFAWDHKSSNLVSVLITQTSIGFRFYNLFYPVQAHPMIAYWKTCNIEPLLVRQRKWTTKNWKLRHGTAHCNVQFDSPIINNH